MTAPIDLSPLWISLATTFAATIATFFLGLLAAWRMCGMRGSLRSWIDGVLTLPLVLPPTVVGFFLLLLLGRRSYIGHALEQLGIVIVFSWPATVIAATVVAFPLMYRTTLGAFEQVNRTLLDAARTLGASELRVFRRVLIPQAAPGVVAGTVLAFARALGEFGATLMLAGNIPGRTQTMPIAIFSAVESGDMRIAFVWVSLIVILSLAIIRLLNLQSRTSRPARSRSAAAVPMAFVGPSGSPAQPACAVKGTPSAALEVHIEKSLEKFDLQVQFVAGKGAVGLLGASGAGKTMTLRMIAAIESPDRGRILLGNRTLFDSTAGVNLPAAQRKIGVVFQDYALFPRMTVAENLGFGLNALPERERRARVRTQLERMHIAELADRYPGEISGGQRQRVAIARCMAIEPEAILFDEPFAALDPHLRRQTEEQLRETLANYNGAVIFVTHDMEEAFRFCSDLLVVDEGKVIASGPKHQLFEDPRTVAAARLTGCKNIVPAIRSADSMIDVEAWRCRLQASLPVPDKLTHVGVRSHHIVFDLAAQGKNTFLCWLVSGSEAPHEMTLYLRLHAAPQANDPPHLQADLPKTAWQKLSVQPQPWRISIDPERLLMLEG
ncbi:MAG: molybdate ABC transporter permease subunit [Terracidiphilus sp.]